MLMPRRWALADRSLARTVSSSAASCRRSRLSCPTERLTDCLELKDYATLFGGAAAPPAQEDEKEQGSAEDQKAGARGQEGEGAALGGGGGDALLDLLGGGGAFEDLLEVPEILVHHDLGVGDEARADLPDPAARQVPVVQRDLDPGAPRAHLLEADLARGLHVAVDGVPGDRLVLLVLGGLGVELHLGAQGALDPPVRPSRSDGPNLLDVGHETRQVLQGPPVVVDLLDRGLHYHAGIHSLGHRCTSLSLAVPAVYPDWGAANPSPALPEGEHSCYPRPGVEARRTHHACARGASLRHVRHARGPAAHKRATRPLSAGRGVARLRSLAPQAARIHLPPDGDGPLRRLRKGNPQGPRLRARRGRRRSRRGPERHPDVSLQRPGEVRRCRSEE